jgi:hypothetical protein
MLPNPVSFIVEYPGTCMWLTLLVDHLYIVSHNETGQDHQKGKVQTLSSINPDKIKLVPWHHSHTHTHTHTHTHIHTHKHTHTGWSFVHSHNETDEDHQTGQVQTLYSINPDKIKPVPWHTHTHIHTHTHTHTPRLPRESVLGSEHWWWEIWSGDVFG